MADPYLGEIRMVAFNYAPQNWALCNGQLLSIAQNTALFSLFGTTYGGNGQTTFGLPNLQGSAPMHAGTGTGLTPRALGETGGETTVTLQSAEMPAHSHSLQGDEEISGTADPAGNMAALIDGDTNFLYAPQTTSLTPMATQAIASAGGSQPHNNMQPYQCVNFIVCLQGLYPPRG